MKEDYSRAHIDGAEDLFKLIRDSHLDFNSPRIWGNVLRYMFVCQIIEAVAFSNSKPKIKILDIGCSNATLFGFLKNNFKFFEAKEIEYVGIDVRQSSLDDARSIYGDEIRLIHLDINDDAAIHDVITEQFDVISAQQVLEHVGKEDAIRMLDSCNKLLFDHGRLVLSAPNPKKHLGEEFISKAVGGQYTKHGHIYEFSFEELKDALEVTNFALLDHFGAITRSVMLDLDNPSEQEKPLSDLTRRFSYGFFMAMFSTAYPERSKNYLISACKK